MKDFPKNSHIQLDLLFAETNWPTVFSWYSELMSSDWTSNSLATYVKLKPEADVPKVETMVTELVKKNYAADTEFKSSFALQPLSQIHQHSSNIQSAEDANSIKPFYLYMFGAIAFLILLIACLNYMNLSTAAAYKRTREIGKIRIRSATCGNFHFRSWMVG